MESYSPTQTEVGEAHVRDGQGGWAIVRPGDRVELLDPKDTFMLCFLKGPGPYKVAWIGRWRCGAKSLYFDINGCGRMGPGAHADDFRIAR